MKYIFVTATLLVALPILALIPGCGGGGDLIGTPPSTPVATSTTTPTGTQTTAPTATVTPNPTSTSGSHLSSTFELNSGQVVALNVAINGSKITGTFVVPKDASAALKLRQDGAIIAIPKGTYTVTGTFASPRSYSLTGTTSEGSFSLSGLLPTSTLTGTYSLTYFSRTDSGTIPKLS